MLDDWGLLLINNYPISLPTVVNIIASSLCKCYFNFVISFLPSGYERGLTGFCGFVKIRVFVGISVFTRVLIYRTFVFF